MRILMVCSVFAPAYVYGGPPRVNLALAQALQRAGQSVLVLTSNANGRALFDVPKQVETRIEGVPVVFFQRSRPKSFFFARGLAHARGVELRPVSSLAALAAARTSVLGAFTAGL